MGKVMQEVGQRGSQLWYEFRALGIGQVCSSVRVVLYCLARAVAMIK